MKFKVFLWALLFSSCLGFALESGEAMKVTAKNGSIVTTAPEGKGWQWTEDHRQGQDYVLTEIKWRRTYPDGDVYFYAKEYAGVQETVESVCSRDWRAYYRPLLPELSVLEVSRSNAQGRNACNVVAEGVSSEGHSLRLQERYLVPPDYVLLLSAAGPPKRIAEMEAEIKSWFSMVWFRALQAVH
jgi:hypothetical protein